MKKTLIIILILSSILFTGCSGKVKLLEPLGFDENEMTVKRGDMFNIKKTDNVIFRETVEVSVKSDAIVKEVKALLGDEVKEGQPLLTLDGASVLEKALEIDEKIDDSKRDNSYLNSLKEADIAIAQTELEKLRSTGASAEEVSEKEKEVKTLSNDYYQFKTKQEKDLSELNLQKMDSGSTDTDIVSPCDGIVLYLSKWNSGESVDKNSIVAVVGKKNSKVIQGEYVSEEFINSCNEYYALINGKKYSITCNPLDQNIVSKIDVFGGVLQNTYYINNDNDDIQYGNMVSIIFISDKKEDVLYVPDDGVYEDVDGYYVYIKKNGKKVRKNVEVGQTWEAFVEITNGLSEGDIIYGK